MFCNGVLVYGFTVGNSLEFAMSKAQTLKALLNEHPYNFFDTDQEIGRKIYFHGLPARIIPYQDETWNIKIYPDVSNETKVMPAFSHITNIAKWVAEYKKRTVFNAEDLDFWDVEDELKNGGYINWGDAMSDSHIRWFR